MKQSLIVTILVGIIALGVGFGGGYAFKNYQLSKNRGNFMMQFQGRGGTGMMGARRFGMGGGVFGEVVSVDDKSLTVKMIDGSSRIVILGDSTTYSKSETGSKSDVKVGSAVAVFGSPNSDGSITAQSIQLNPVNRPSPSPASK